MNGGLFLEIGDTEGDVGIFLGVIVKSRVLAMLNSRCLSDIQIDQRRGQVPDWHSGAILKLEM